MIENEKGRLMLTFPLAVPPATPIKNGVLLSKPLADEYSDDFSAIFCVNIDLSEFPTPKTPQQKPARPLRKTADIDITADIADIDMTDTLTKRKLNHDSMLLAIV